MEDFWNTKRGKAIVKLSIWIVFILIVLSFIKNYDNDKIKDNNEEVKQHDVLSNNTLLKELLNSNYEYEYNITVGENKYSFKGNKIGDINTGYKESNTGIIKYEIEQDVVYQIVMDQRLEINDFYNELNKEYLDLSFINELLENEPSEVYTIDDVEFIISSEDKHITKIEINSDEYSYNLEFFNIEVY